MAIRSSRSLLCLPAPLTSLSTFSSSPPSVAAGRIPQRQGGDDDEALVANVVSILREQRSKSRWGFLRSIYRPTGFTAAQAAQIILRLRSNPRLALRFFHWSEAASLCRHDLYSYATIIHVLARSRLRSAAQSLIQSAIIRAHGGGDGENEVPEIFVALARTYRACDSASFVFDLLVRACLQAKQIDRAVEIVRMLRSRGIYPAVGTCNELIRTVSKARGSETGHDIFQEVFGIEEGEIRVRSRARVLPNVQTFNALLLSSYRDGRSEIAGEIRSDMEKFNCYPNGFTYSILMAGFCDKGNVEEAKGLWEEMAIKGIKPDAMAYNTMISGFCSIGEMESAEELFRGMALSEIEPTCTTYERLIRGYCGTGDVDSAILLYGEMVRKNFRPEVSTVDEVVDELCKKNRVVEGLGVLRDEMRKGAFFPSRVSFALLIKGLCGYGKMEEALKLQSEMAMAGFEPDSEVYSAFIEGYVGRGDLEKVGKLKDERLEQEGLGEVEN